MRQLAAITQKISTKTPKIAAKSSAMDKCQLHNDATKISGGRGWRKPAGPDTLLCFAVDVGAGNDDDVRGCHNPKGVIAGYWDFDAEPHNRNQS
jgi:hypothetical protein